MTLNQLFTDIADAIRNKKGTSGSIIAEDFPTEIAEINTGNLTDEEYEEANDDLDDILEGTVPITIYPPDWSEIGYSETPQHIIDQFNYAKEIQTNWDDSVTTFKFENDLKLGFMPMVNTSNMTTMYSMFSRCGTLSSIPLLDTSNVTNMGSMFYVCSALTSIPQLDTSNVTDMSDMFADCNALTTIPLLNTSNVRSMSSMFSSCDSLITIPLLNTSNVTSMNSMFYYCSALTAIPQLNTSSVTSMSYMFTENHSLTTVPQLDTSKVTNMNGMFRNCTSLSNESLNNILAMCANATRYTGTKTLATLGITSVQATICQGLSNYQAFLDAGWTTGY